MELKKAITHLINGVYGDVLSGKKKVVIGKDDSINNI